MLHKSAILLIFLHTDVMGVFSLMEDIYLLQLFFLDIHVTQLATAIAFLKPMWFSSHLLLRYLFHACHLHLMAPLHSLFHHGTYFLFILQHELLMQFSAAFKTVTVSEWLSPLIADANISLTLSSSPGHA